MSPEAMRYWLDRCRSVFFVPDKDRTAEARHAALVAFTEALVRIPATAVDLAFEHWVRTHQNMPTPANIATLAGRKVDGAKDALRLSDQPSTPLPPVEDRPFYVEERTATELAQRRAFAERKMRAYGFSAKPDNNNRNLAQIQYGTDQKTGLGPPPLFQRPMTDEAITQLLKSNPRITDMSVERFREIHGVSQPGGAERDRKRMAERRVKTVVA